MLQRTLKTRFWFWLFWKGLDHLAGGWGACANRKWRTFSTAKYEFTVIQRDKSKSDMHSREEVYRMLQTVRVNEERMKWKCPEPELPKKQVTT